MRVRWNRNTGQIKIRLVSMVDISCYIYYMDFYVPAVVKSIGCRNTKAELVKRWRENKYAKTDIA